MEQLENGEPRVLATEEALAFIEEIRKDHPDILFHQSGGCCDGSSPMCYPANEYLIGGGDVKLGEIGGVPVRACPEIAIYGPGGAISSWRELMTAAVVVRSMLGVSPSAYQEACEVMGPENAAVAIACMLERSGHINSAGGYLRDLTRKSARGEFSLGPMLMALLRLNRKPVQSTG